MRREHNRRAGSTAFYWGYQYRCEPVCRGMHKRIASGRIRDASSGRVSPSVKEKKHPFQNTEQRKNYPIKNIPSLIMEQTTIRQDRQPHWYALWVYRSLVSPIITACGRDGVSIYRPMRLAETFTDRGLEYGEEPLVPNLLFVKASCAYVIGLKQLTQNRGRAYCYPGTAIPAPIDDKTMEMFMFVVKCGGRRLEPVTFPIDKGDRVRVTEGLFKGAEGYIRRVHGTKLLVVAIEGVVAVAVSHIPRQWLERIGPPRTERSHSPQDGQSWIQES